MGNGSFLKKNMFLSGALFRLWLNGEFGHATKEVPKSLFSQPLHQNIWDYWKPLKCILVRET